jgi:hypothetical protein
VITVRKILAIFLSVFFLIIGCTGGHINNIDQESKHFTQDIGRDYLEGKGYKIISSEGLVQSYELTKGKLMELPYSMYWGLQTTDPEPFLNKNVDVYKFVVKNHSLDNWQSSSVHPKLS